MRVIAVVAVSLGLAGCSSTSFDMFKSKPPEVTLQLESVPPGADATTSVGPGCKTPCSVTVAAADNFTVTYALKKYQPETVQVTVTKQTGSPPVLDPNPVVAELKPATPVKKPAKKKPRAPAAAPADDPGDGAASPFPPVR